MAESTIHPQGTQGGRLSEPPGCSCFLALIVAALALLAVAQAECSQPGWDANRLGGLLMALVGTTMGGLVLGRLLQGLVDRRPADRGDSGTSRPQRALTVAAPLERQRPTGWGVLLLWGVALFWNVPLGVVATGTVGLWVQHGWPFLPLLILVVLFAVFGTVVIGLAGYATVVEFPGLRGLRPPEVKLSAHPLRPGGNYEMTLKQLGPLHLRTLQVLLLCEQQVPYPDGEGGTNTRVVTVYLAELIREEDLRIDEDRPYTSRCPFQLPEEARPSLEVEPNQVRWKLGVKGRRPGWHLGFQFDYSVGVVPRDPS
jgi:hypothetical protein